MHQTHTTRGPSPSRSRRLALAGGAALAFLAPVALPGLEEARAGSYAVTSCDNSPGGNQSHAWPGFGGSGMYHRCPSTTNFTNFESREGMVTRVTGSTDASTFSRLRFTPPGGNTITGMRLTGYYVRNDPKMANQIRAQGPFFGDTTIAGNNAGQGPDSFPYSNTYLDTNDNTTALLVNTQCGASSCSAGAAFRMHGTIVYINDPTAPVLTPVGGGFSTDDWLRGSQVLRLAQSDNAGIKRTHVLLAGGGGGKDAITDFSCNYSSPRPCNDQTSDFQIDTTLVADGSHSLNYVAVDAADNLGGGSRTVNIDNTVPARVTATVQGGEGWRGTNDFNVTYNNPPSAAPITRVHYELCPTQPSDPCTTSSKPVSGTTLNLQVPTQGAYRLKLWLEDAAGNVSANNASDPVMLRYDNVAPGRAKPDIANGWLNAQEALAFDQRIPLEPGAFRPVSEIAGYSITTDGSDPDGTINQAGDPATYRINGLPEGRTNIKARAISGAGIASTQVGSTEVKVDKSPPAVDAIGGPDPGRWQRTPVDISIKGVDQPNLSTMAGASPGQPVEEGAYVAYRLDGGPLQRVRGEATTVSVGTDGRHTLTYEAVDFAGNPSGERTVAFKIDRTAPSGSFDYQDPADPRELGVSTFDAASGIEGGQIELRREGAGEFKPLATQLQGSRLVARLDDLALPNGRYEFRARTRDVAGNDGVLDRRQDGEAMVLTLPVRLETRVRVSGLAASRIKKVGCARPKRRSPARRKRCTRKVVVRPGGAKLKLRYAKRGRSVGQVTSLAGLPVAGAFVAVEAQDRTGGAYRRIGAARGDKDGIFRYRLPAGPSRNVRYRYEGTNVIRPSEAGLKTLVAAAVKLKVNRRQVRNGQAVVFSGRLLGKPLPKAGKVVSLQARLGKKWRTFATPRAKKGGTFKSAYRFTSTRGVKAYKFRVLVPRSADYAFENGTSNTVSVTVRGR